MIIKQKRIRSLNKYLGFVKVGRSLVVAVADVSRHREALTRAGFSSPFENGDSLLPAPLFGPVSRYNAEGAFLIHKDQAKETAVRQILWHWTEWHGPYREEQSKIVDVSYQRYPRTFLPPPSVELGIAATREGQQLVVSKPVLLRAGNEDRVLHVINLFLEIFGECQVLSENLAEIVKAPVRQLNWRVLPPGRRPWNQLRAEIDPMLKRAPEGNQQVIAARFHSVNGYNPEFLAVGQGGFTGYVIFGFPERNLFVCESMYAGNATYVFDEQWERLSRMTKAEILDDNLQQDRIIHREGWGDRIREILG